MKYCIFAVVKVLSASAFCLLGFVATVSAESAWLNVMPGKKLEYPRDHASHPEYPVEWWYITGHLRRTNTDALGSESTLGFQVTFFRVGIKSGEGPSKWHSKALIISHSAITDERAGTYCSEEHSGRAALGMAGADDKRLHVWVGEQSLEEGADGGFKSSFNCKGRKLEVDFNPTKPLVLHGNNGYVQKGIDQGDASYYASYTRMSVSGAISDGADSSKVVGDAWFDHEIVSSAVGRADVGWDWFALQLNDNSEVMIYRLRDAKGERRQFSRGAYVAADGNVTELSPNECELTPKERWRSAVTGASYPLSWAINCHSPGSDFSLNVKATQQNQEFAGGGATGKRYWEGRVLVTGISGGKAVSGSGYLEMVNTTE
jgi:predicted secreted hydrolase